MAERFRRLNRSDHQVGGNGDVKPKGPLSREKLEKVIGKWPGGCPPDTLVEIGRVGINSGALTRP